MKTYLNTETGLLTLAAGATTGIRRIDAKRGDLFLLEVVPTGTITGATGVFAAKSTYSGDPVALASSWDAPETESTGYLFTIDLNTTDLNALFTSEIAEVTLLAEITWSLAGAIRSTQTLSLVVARDVWRGDEADPTAASDLKATQAEAEAGTENTKWVTPLRAFQSIASWIAGHASTICSAINATVAPAWTNVSGKPDLSRTFGITVDGAGQVLTAGSKGFVTIPYDCTITHWYLAADQAGELCFNVNRNGSNISGEGYPFLTNTVTGNASASNWDAVTISAGDVLEFILTEFPATITRVNLVIKAI